MYSFPQDDLVLNAVVLNWPKSIAPIFDQNDEVWPISSITEMTEALVESIACNIASCNWALKLEGCRRHCSGQIKRDVVFSIDQCFLQGNFVSLKTFLLKGL